jgi:hypothetical protein
VSVHSVRFVGLEVSDASAHTPYTVPAGQRAILKCVTVKNKATAAAACAVFAKTSGGAFVFDFAFYLTATNTNGDTYIALPWVVLNAGDVLGFQFGGAAGGFCSMSGALLTL